MLQSPPVFPIRQIGDFLEYLLVMSQRKCEPSLIIKGLLLVFLKKSKISQRPPFKQFLAISAEYKLFFSNPSPPVICIYSESGLKLTCCLFHSLSVRAMISKSLSFLVHCPFRQVCYKKTCINIFKYNFCCMIIRWLQNQIEMGFIFFHYFQISV